MLPVLVSWHFCDVLVPKMHPGSNTPKTKACNFPGASIVATVVSAFVALEMVVVTVAAAVATAVASASAEAGTGA